MRSGYRDLLIALFAIGIVLGLVFGGGVVLGRNSAPEPTPIAAAGGAAGAAAPAATAGGGGGTNVLAGQTIGTVTAVDGDALTIRGQDGRTSIMAESLSTRVTNSVPGTVNDIRPGAFVAISPGPPDAQGRTIATTILILPAGLTSAAPSGTAAAGATGGAAAARPSTTPGAAGSPGASATPPR